MSGGLPVVFGTETLTGDVYATGIYKSGYVGLMYFEIEELELKIKSFLTVVHWMQRVGRHNAAFTFECFAVINQQLSTVRSLSYLKYYYVLLLWTDIWIDKHYLHYWQGNLSFCAFFLEFTHKLHNKNWTNPDKQIWRALWSFFFVWLHSTMLCCATKNGRISTSANPEMGKVSWTRSQLEQVHHSVTTLPILPWRA